MGLFEERTGDLITYWKSVGAITTLVGSGSSAKIWPDAAAEGYDAPFIYFIRNGGVRHRRLAGHNGGRLTVVHVYCWGRTSTEADTLAAAIENNTVDYRGTMGSTRIMYVYQDDVPESGYEPIEPDSDKKRFWRRVTLRFVHD